MLVIRNEQLGALQGLMRSKFEQSMVDMIFADFAPKAALLGSEGTQAFVRRAVAAGNSQGIRSEGAVAVLIELKMQFGEHFECSPDRRWAERILGHPVLPDYIRVAVVRERMTARTNGRILMPAGGATSTPGLSADEVL